MDDPKMNGPKKGAPAEPVENEKGAASASDIDLLDFESPMRDLPPLSKAILFLAGVLYALFHILVLNFYHMDEWVFRTLHVNLGAAIGFLIYVGWKGQRKDRIHPLDFVLVIGILLRFMHTFMIYAEPFVLTGGGPGSSTTFLSQTLTTMAIGQQDLGPSAAFSLIYFLIILAVCYVFYVTIMNMQKDHGDRRPGGGA